MNERFKNTFDVSTDVNFKHIFSGVFEGREIAHHKNCL